MPLAEKQYNERLKLSATALNAIGLGVFGFGLARPIVEAWLNDGANFQISSYFDIRYIAVLIAAFVLHASARALFRLMLQE